MRTYTVTTITGQVLTIEARRVEFGPGHVSFWLRDNRLVRALRTPMVATVTEKLEP